MQVFEIGPKKRICKAEIIHIAEPWLEKRTKNGCISFVNCSFMNASFVTF